MDQSLAHAGKPSARMSSLVNDIRKLIEETRAAVHGVAFAHLGNHADAEDVSQDTFVRTFAALGNIPDTRRLGGWLVTVARNCCRDMLCKRGRQGQVAPSLHRRAACRGGGLWRRCAVGPLTSTGAPATVEP